MWFQNTSLPTLWTAIGNFKGLGGLKIQNVLGKYETELDFVQGGQTKNLLWGVWMFSGATQHEAVVGMRSGS